METALVGFHNSSLDTLLDVEETLRELACQPIYFENALVNVSKTSDYETVNIRKS